MVIREEKEPGFKRPLNYFSNIDKLKLDKYDRLPVREKKPNVMEEVRKSRQKLIASGQAIMTD